jgi:hypothetical protein
MTVQVENGAMRCMLKQALGGRLVFIEVQTPEPHLTEDPGPAAYTDRTCH